MGRQIFTLKEMFYFWILFYDLNNNTITSRPMTKFQRAKAQTLHKWEAILWSWIEKCGCKWTTCGFCEGYHIHDTSFLCKDCPIYKLEGQDCTDAAIDEVNTDEGDFCGRKYDVQSAPEEIDRQISLVMAVLIYVEQMEG